ncbi:interferon lambda receptor 1 [Emys orbicularis]|uniref:interferon lambda receptor 1 n=1 Tax=Emys orbicularis TaxID=82168 RepID=UPI0031FD9F46
MSAGRIGILVALSSLQQILGSVALGQPTVRLSPPRNVTLLSKDFGMALTWLPGEGSPPDVLYTVRYRSWNQVKQWEKVQHCRNISQTTCNLTCVSDPFNKFSARVKALSAGRQSPWVESGFMEYQFDVELAPPALEVSVSESTINVSAAFPLASCVESIFIDLKYDLGFWEAGTEDKQMQYCDNMKWDKVTINTREISGNYCLSARASFQVIKLKHSEFSKPMCMLFKSKAVDWKFLVTIAVPLLVLLFLCAAAASILCLCKQAAKRVKRPQALDFSHFRAPRKILEKEPSEKEFFEEDLLVCMEKPELGGRRSGPSVRNNVSLNASLLSLWEEEEEDDSSSFRPYTEMPRFLKRAPNCQVASTSHQGTQSGSELGGSHLEGGSVSDLAGLGFSQLVWRRGSAKEDTSGFQDSEKSFLSESSSLGDFSLIEARYPATNGHGQLVCQGDTFLQMTVLMEGLNGKPPAYEQRLQMRHPHNTNHQRHPYPDPIVCVALEVSQDSDGFPLEGQLVCFQTLKLAEDEGIASDSDSLTVCSEEDPPSLASLVSETFEAETRGKGGSLQQESDPIFKFQGYQHVRYMPRN